MFVGKETVISRPSYILLVTGLMDYYVRIDTVAVCLFILFCLVINLRGICESGVWGDSLGLLIRWQDTLSSTVYSKINAITCLWLGLFAHLGSLACTRTNVEGHVTFSNCILRASLIPVKFESFFGLLRKWHICSFTLCCPLNAEIHDLEILIFSEIVFPSVSL